MEMGLTGQRLPLYSLGRLEVNRLGFYSKAARCEKEEDNFKQTNKPFSVAEIYHALLQPLTHHRNLCE